jgi:hypothetical protein
MGGSVLPERMEEYQQHAKYTKIVLVYANSCAKWTPTTAVAIHQLHNLFSTFHVASCQLLRPLALAICRDWELLHYVKNSNHH